uniref:Uncharacterized protein n=1 Tax=Arundo donax TaxID=35708 RepID=A0A0A8ZB16_ARUDO
MLIMNYSAQQDAKTKYKKAQRPQANITIVLIYEYMTVRLTIEDDKKYSLGVHKMKG